MIYDSNSKDSWLYERNSIDFVTSNDIITVLALFTDQKLHIPLVHWRNNYCYNNLLINFFQRSLSFHPNEFNWGMKEVSESIKWMGADEMERLLGYGPEAPLPQLNSIPQFNYFHCSIPSVLPVLLFFKRETSCTLQLSFN